MPRNVEIKARIENFDELLPLVRSVCDDAGHAVLLQEDTFFNTREGRLKLRKFELSQRKSELIFYDRRDDTEGPKLSDYAKADVENTATTSMKEVLTRAHGVKGIVRKCRQLFIYQGQTRVHLDRVEGLGDFLEFEVCLKDHQTLAEGHQIADDLLALLQIPTTALVRGAYLDHLNPIPSVRSSSLPSTSVAMDPPLSHRPKISGPSTDEHNPAPITRDSPTPPSAAVLYDLESQRVIAATPSADEMNGGNPRRRIPYPEVLANFAIIFVIGFITVELLGWIGPYRRGFFCDDDTIRLPYKSIQTVPVWMLLVYGLGLPAVVLSLGELARMMSPKTADERLSELEHGQQPPMRVLVRFVYFYGHYLIAFAATNIFTAIAKYPVGRLRPHFIDLCKPTIDGSTFEAFCNFTQNWHTYIDIDQYSCDKAVSQDLIQEARLSFFSGHSSTAMCASVFVAIYLHARQAPLMRIRLVVLVPLLQIFVLSMGMLIAYSRVQDHMHHSTDVLIGMTTGSSIAAFTAMHIAGLDISAKNRGRFLLVPMRDSSAETGAKTSETTTMTAESMNGVGGGGVGMGTAR